MLGRKYSVTAATVTLADPPLPGGSMLLLGPYEINPMDDSNIFSLSTAMLKKLGKSYGFHAIFEEDSSADPPFKLNGRGTIVLKRISDEENAYADWSFPIAPLAPVPNNAD